MTSWLSSEVVALHLENSTTKAFVFNYGHTASTFLHRLAFHIFNLANIHSINLPPSNLPTHLNVEANYDREDWFQSGTFFLT